MSFFLKKGGTVLLAAAAVSATDYFHDKAVDKIAFGSCNKPYKDQSLWNAVAKEHADVWVWTGDAVYADTMRLPHWWVESPMEVIRERYAEGKRSKEYTEAIRDSQVIGILDDHDGGHNNFDGSYERKDQVKEIFLDFIGDPPDSPRRSRPGVYESHVWGPPGRRVKAILLDIRHFYHPNAERSPILGEEQWRWLDNELREDDGATFTFIVSGTQVVSLGHTLAEGWGHFPSERQRLFDTIATSQRRGVFFITGDVHYAEISVARCGSQLSSSQPSYPLYELCSSGITHAWGLDLWWLGPLLPWAMRGLVPGFQRVEGLEEPFLYRNYGTLDFAWGGDGDGDEATVVRAAIRDVQGNAVLGRNLTLAELSPSEAHARDYAVCEEVSEALVEQAWRAFSVLATITTAVVLLVLAFVALVSALCCGGKRRSNDPKTKTE